MAGIAAVTDRLAGLRGRLADLDAAAFLVTNGTNVRYLCGFESSNAALVVDSDRAVLLTDGRYVEAAQAIENVEVVQAERDLAKDLAERLAGLTPGPVAFEAAHVTVATHATLAGSGVELSPSTGVVEALRAVKDEAELDAIRRAAAILDEALVLLADEPVIGRSECEIAWWVERTLRDLGADALSFDPIVAGGPNAARPHHRPGDRVIGPDEVLLVDAGCKVDGYCSDCTRPFATGPLPEELGRAYAVCLEAQLESLVAVKAGVLCRDVDAIARGRIGESGYVVYHGLGHAVGLEIHESPRLTDTSSETIEIGNVLTVEPGVYLPDVGGIRIEDLVIVGEDGPEILTPVTKELVRLS